MCFRPQIRKELVQSAAVHVVAIAGDEHAPCGLWEGVRGEPVGEHLGEAGEEPLEDPFLKPAMLTYKGSPSKPLCR